MNENWDDDVRADMSDALDKIVVEDKGSLHLLEKDREEGYGIIGHRGAIRACEGGSRLICWIQRTRAYIGMMQRGVMICRCVLTESYGPGKITWLIGEDRHTLSHLS